MLYPGFQSLLPAESLRMHLAKKILHNKQICLQLPQINMSLKLMKSTCLLTVMIHTSYMWYAIFLPVSTVKNKGRYIILAELCWWWYNKDSDSTSAPNLSLLFYMYVTEEALLEREGSCWQKLLFIKRPAMILHVPASTRMSETSNLIEDELGECRVKILHLGQGWHNLFLGMVSIPNAQITYS